jgi:simple sugar transport system ATP-binding protein
VYASSDLDEIVRASDRVLVLSGGRISHPLDAATLETGRLGRMIGGSFDEADPDQPTSEGAA